VKEITQQTMSIKAIKKNNKKSKVDAVSTEGPMEEVKAVSSST
jgi:hypothetical protein